MEGCLRILIWSVLEGKKRQDRLAREGGVGESSSTWPSAGSIQHGHGSGREFREFYLDHKRNLLIHSHFLSRFIVLILVEQTIELATNTESLKN